MFQFRCPPLPYFLTCGEDVYEPGRKHMSRHSIGVFDLLVVTGGCLYMAEEDEQWEVKAGCCLLLRPDRFHYAPHPCAEETHFYWLHFETTGEWAPVAAGKTVPQRPSPDAARFALLLPRFSRLADPPGTYRRLNALLGLARRSGMHLKHQLAFQELLLALESNPAGGAPSAVFRLAEEAAAYLREHYHDPYHSGKLSAALRFHPAYIARCMNRVFGCTPLEYVTRYRIEQAKRMLMNTDWPIGRVAEEAGFETFSFFSRCFRRLAGVAPREYRRRMWTPE